MNSVILALSLFAFIVAVFSAPTGPNNNQGFGPANNNKGPGAGLPPNNNGLGGNGLPPNGPHDPTGMPPTGMPPNGPHGFTGMPPTGMPPNGPLDVTGMPPNRGPNPGPGNNLPPAQPGRHP
ncbi:unnamed protein product [Adineta steineri]|uniref:Uncharacterized protein n=1 Tax=Adineta steineri TaxID=433720 RepID=A0A815V3B3_9BILA|nr:unnamed protein product [Adineta steineri]CAF1652213.1 unnamed protein product [Adineta steineri]